MNPKQTELKLALLKERGYVCENCHIRLATDQHHCLIHRDIRFKELDVKENLMLVCHLCHMTGEVDSKIVRDRFWVTQCRRYGEAHMLQWLDSLPLKIKPRFSNAQEEASRVYSRVP
jgi:hypothetical protein